LARDFGLFEEGLEEVIDRKILIFGRWDARLALGLGRHNGRRCSG
jgi:hypothetical protein